jgi:hypothetical protein
MGTYSTPNPQPLKKARWMDEEHGDILTVADADGTSDGSWTAPGSRSDFIGDYDELGALISEWDGVSLVIYKSISLLEVVYKDGTSQRFTAVKLDSTQPAY